MASRQSGILSNYMPIPESGCWLWLGAWSLDGYGKLGGRRNGMPAHRFFYEAHVSPIPAGLFICHKCDVRACVNPGHMFVGTHTDNMRDMVQKGRAGGAAGDSNGRAKLKASQVLDIYSSSKSRPELADQYGVVYATIFNIQNGIKWASVTGHRSMRR